MSTEPRATRRALLGYAGTGGLGVAAGAGLAVGLGAEDEAAAGATPVVPTTVSPFGVHQPGITAPTPRANHFLSLDLEAGRDRDDLARLMRQWTGSIVALTQGRPAPGDRAPDLAQPNTDLTVTIGWGRTLFDTVGLADQRPPALAAVPPLRHDRLQEAWSGGDLFAMVAADDDTTASHATRQLLLDAAPFAHLRWEQHGSWRGLDGEQQHQTGRNLFGQVDGTGNLTPADPLFDSTVWTKTPDWFAGGTTFVIRRIRMDLDLWDTLTREEQERSVGRDLAIGAPLTGDQERDLPDFDARDDAGRPVIPEDSHLRLSHPEFNGGARILRRGVNYTAFDPHTGRREAGLVFCSFQADLESQFNRIQRQLDRSDSLNAWTTAIGSAEFAILPGFAEDGWLGDTLLG